MTERRCIHLVGQLVNYSDHPPSQPKPNPLSAQRHWFQRALVYNYWSRMHNHCNRSETGSKYLGQYQNSFQSLPYMVSYRYGQWQNTVRALCGYVYAVDSAITCGDMQCRRVKGCASKLRNRSDVKFCHVALFPRKIKSILFFLKLVTVLFHLLDRSM